MFNPSNAEVLAGMVAAGLASVGYGVWEWHRRVQLAEAAKHWTVVRGEILSAEVIVHEDSDGDEYEARVRYAYSVGGRRLLGDRTQAGGKIKSPNETLVRGIIAPYRAGDRVLVRFDPANPDRAVLEAAPTVTGLKGWLIFGGFLLASSAYIAMTLTFPSPFQ
jgi:hypothetical protein